MDLLRYNDLLQNEELFFQSGEMIKNSIFIIRKQIHSLKKMLKDSEKKITTDFSSEFNVENPMLKFYGTTLDDLLRMERYCEEYLLAMKIDLLRASKDRLRPPSRLSLGKVIRTCCIDPEEQKVSCRCTWENIPRNLLDDTRKILLAPRKLIKTEFDETDLKFKQDLVFLRTKMFKFHEKSSKKQKLSIDATTRKSGLIIVERDLPKMHSLKFIDEDFVTNDTWTRILDARGDQFGSKWHLVLRPQIEKIVKKRRIPMLHLDPRLTFQFLSNIPENGLNFVLTRRDLISLLCTSEDVLWVNSWKLQLLSVNGQDVAATLIQNCWRGYQVRIKIWDSERLYIAASLIWLYWISLKNKRQLYDRYLKKMLKSIHTTRELGLRFSYNFSNMKQVTHVVIHLTSLGYPVNIRRTIPPKDLRIEQNMGILRLSFARNPKTLVIYILPVRKTRDLLTMYSDLLRSVSSDEEIIKRITFIELAHAETFRNRALNVSRILHCSDKSLEAIRTSIDGKPAYFLPWIIDECDLRLAGNLDIPLMSPDIELQRNLLNVSRVARMIDAFGLLQPVYRADIKDYDTLCECLAQMIVQNTAICEWALRTNSSAKEGYYAVFLINHISVPFMPIMRREKERLGKRWDTDSTIRQEFLSSLREQLPKVVDKVVKPGPGATYRSWKEFYSHIQANGCLLQAIPNEKDASFVSVSIFLPGKSSGEKPQWKGTADKLYRGSISSSFCYMIPITSVDISTLKVAVNKFAVGIQEDGYFGYLTIECYCYPNVLYERLEVCFLTVFPYYSCLQSYFDWVKFAIMGKYSTLTNSFIADVSLVPDVRRRRSAYFLPRKTPKWNETKERYMIVIPKLQHVGFSACRWSKLKSLLKETQVVYNSKEKQGSHVILYDGEVKDFATMLTISSSMVTTLSMTCNNLTKLSQALTTATEQWGSTNLMSFAEFFSKFALEYQQLTAEKCS